MFSSKKDEKNAVTAPPAAMQGSGAARRMPRSSAAPSIISADLTIAGTLTSTGDVQIDGRIEGDVHSAGLVIGDKAFIHGDVTAEEVTVRGRVQAGEARPEGEVLQGGVVCPRLPERRRHASHVEQVVLPRHDNARAACPGSTRPTTTASTMRLPTYARATG